MYFCFMVMRFTLVYFANSYGSVYFIYNIYDKFFLSIFDFLYNLDALTKVHLALFQFFESRRCIGYACPLLKFYRS